MKFDDIIYEKRDNVAKVTINRPQVHNAFRLKTIREMIAAFRDAALDPTVGVVVVKGAGEKAFSSGGDVDAEASEEIDEMLGTTMLEFASAIRNCPKPVIAAVRGWCIGGGHELHLWCDLTIAAEDAKFGQIGPKMGMSPVWGGTQMLPRIVGEKRAREIVYLCRQYDAREAKEMGLVNKVVPPDKLDEEVDKWCRELLDKSPQSLRVAKVSLNSESDMLYASLAHGQEMIRAISRSDEVREGGRAFLEKRKPDWNKFRRKRQAG